MKRLQLQFTAPREIRIVSSTIPKPDSDEVLIESRYSAISSGTELLAYRGLLPADLALDDSLAGMQENVKYPFKYGYAVVGHVVALGKNVTPSLAGAPVFVFHPHDSHFVVSKDAIIRLPQDMPLEDAVFLANMETAVGFLMDGRPIIGERILVIGQGIVGLLTTALLRLKRLYDVTVLDVLEKRRIWAQCLGDVTALAPDRSAEPSGDASRFDLVYELSGSPDGLNAAIESARYGGRIVIGSWYGTKRAALNLGGRYHRAKISIYASQVSKIDPSHAACWSKHRRLGVALEMLRRVAPRKLISHQYSLQNADRAFNLLDKGGPVPMQVIFKY